MVMGDFRPLMGTVADLGCGTNRGQGGSHPGGQRLSNFLADGGSGAEAERGSEVERVGAVGE
jgi:hypothetical protein